MRRIIDHFLLQWKSDKLRKPLLLRGARQIGKTHSARQLGTTYSDFVEINLERRTDAHIIFERDLEPTRMIRELSLIARKPIIPGQTLLFLDEIQAVPRAITALRYFYELMPELHVIAAGSLLDFSLMQIGIPVGRVQSLYMHPLSFIEYLAAVDEPLLIDEILHHNITEEMGPAIHTKLLGLLGEYLALGGMPDSVHNLITTKDPLTCAKVHTTLLDTYRQDFGAYARKLQVKYVALLFDQVPLQLGRKFKYSIIEGEYRKRELAPALDLLIMAGVAHKVFHTAGHGIPLGAQVDLQDYKTIFLDAGLAQAALGLDVAGWFLQPAAEFINKGSLVEAFVGQELLAYTSPHSKNNLYYWHKEAGTRQAEIDYLIELNRTVIPVEVKAGSGRTLKSLQQFLETHSASPYGIRCSTQNYSVHEKIHSYPLYALAKILSDHNDEMRLAIKLLVER